MATSTPAPQPPRRPRCCRRPGCSSPAGDGPGALAEAERSIASLAAEPHVADQPELARQLALARNLAAWTIALLLLEDRLPDALSMIDAAIAVAPDEVSIIDTRWAVLAAMGRGAEAVDGLRHTVGLPAEVVGAELGATHAFLARALIDAGQPDEARTHAHEAARLECTWPILANVWARLAGGEQSWARPAD